MPLTLLIESELDERSASAAALRAERVYADASRNISKSMTSQIGDGARESSKAIEKMADNAQASYRKMLDAQDELAMREQQLKQMREDGARGVEVQAERVRQARKREKEAIREAAAEFDAYERAAQRAGDSGEAAAGSFASGLSRAAGAARSAGGDLAGGVLDGFAGAGIAARLAGLMIPGAGLAALGVTTGALLAEGIREGLASLAVQDMYQARLGVDNATIERLGRNAGDAYAAGWGSSPAQNLEVQQLGIHAGLIDTNASQADLQKFIGQMHAAQAAIGQDAEAIALGTMNFVNTGLVSSTTDALDVMVAASQRGMNITGDLLESAREYGVVWSAVGLSARDAFGMIKQMKGARDVDQAADSLKELAINAVDGSDLTAQAFAAMGLNAERLTAKFAEGGPAARQAFGEVLAGFQQIKDPVERQNVGMALFKTKWEDAKKAIVGADLPTAAKQLGDIAGATDKASVTVSQHADQWDLLGRNIEKAKNSITQYLADSPLGDLYNLPATALNDLFDPSRIDARYGPPGAIAGAAPGMQLNPMDILTGQGPASAGRSLTDLLNPSAAPGTPGAPSSGNWFPASAAPGTPGLGSALDPADRVPVVPMGTGGADGKPSFDPSQYSVSAIPVQGNIPLSPLAPGAPGARLVVDPGKVFDAETSEMSARASVEAARVRVLEMEAAGTYTEQEIQAAKAQRQTAERSYLSAEAKLQEAQRGSWQKMENTAKAFADGMDGINAGLDADLGISKGLSGIADNLVRFLGNLALAGPMAQMNAISNANPNQGFGMMGMLASQGLFGSQYTPQAMAAAGGYGAPGAPGSSYGGYGALAGGGQPYGMPIGSNSGGYGGGGAQFPAWVYELGARFGLKPSTYPGHQEGSGANKGIDWSGPVDAMQRFAEYLATIPGALEQVIWQNPNTGQKIGIADGQFVGPGTSQPGYYANDFGGHQDHVHTRQSFSIPIPGGGSMPAPSYAPLSQDALTNPDLTPGPTVPGSPVIQPGAGLPGGMSPGLNFQPTPSWGGGNADLPSVTGGGGGRGYMGLDNGPGIGGAAGQDPYGVAPTTAPGGGGGIGITPGGTIDTAIGIGAAAGNIIPGAGAAAQALTKLASRGVQFAGQAAGIGVDALMQTFLPQGSQKAGSGWLQRGVGAISSVTPALPNLAGGKSPTAQNGDANHGAQGQQGGNTVNYNTTVNSSSPTVSGTLKDAEFHLGAQNSGPGHY